MAETTLTHKLRNPKSYNDWMDIWTATVQDGNTYTITPSSKWKISADNLNNIPVNKIESSIDTSQGSESTIHNVTITNPAGDHIAITDSNGTIKEGAEIKKITGDENQFLNQKGEWTPLKYKIITSLDNTDPADDKDHIIFTLIKNESDIISRYTVVSFSTDGAQEATPDKKPLKFIHLEDNNNIIGIKIAANAVFQDGVVPKGDGHPNAFWKTDENGNPSWRTINLKQLPSAMDSVDPEDSSENGLLGKILRIDENGNAQWQLLSLLETKRFDFIAPRWGHGTFDEGSSINDYAILPRYDSSWDVNNEVGSGADRTHAYRLIINQKEIYKYALQWQ